LEPTALPSRLSSLAEAIDCSPYFDKKTGHGCGFPAAFWKPGDCLLGSAVGLVGFGNPIEGG